ncbi:ift122 [Symbiodinium sp. CCMP2592]|nr:ift122 [Symbiodinium sp. CCMP2592]
MAAGDVSPPLATPAGTVDDVSPSLQRESSPDPTQPEVMLEHLQLQEQRQLAVSAVSAMECTCPSFVRAVPAWAVLRSFGQVLRGTNMNANELYSMSFQVDSIDEFWSHSWHSIVFLKVWLLLMLKNGRAACVGGTMIATLVAYLSYADVLPGWYKEPRLQGPGYSGEFRFSPWANLSGCASALLLLLFWQSSSKVFLDRTCIHQGDGRLKAEGIINLGALLKKSRTLVVVWDPSYLSRLWCVFELAAFIHGHREDPSSSLKKHLVIKPSVLVPLTFLVGANSALTLLFETALPDTDVVAFMRIVLFAGSQFPLIYIIQRLWRKVMDAEKQFRNFSMQKVKCYCCSVNHLDQAGKPMPCDKEIIADCIVEWYGSVEDFEVGVRTHVHDAFIEQVSRFPLGYQWTVGMTTCILWGQLDAIAARAHGGAYSYAASVVVVTMAWFLWVTPTHFLIMIRIIAYLMETCQSKSLLFSSLATCVGYIVIGVFTFLPHALQALLYQAFPEPLVGAGVFWGVTLCTAGVSHYFLARPWKGASGPGRTEPKASK